jgi:hypothetical protein
MSPTRSVHAFGGISYQRLFPNFNWTRNVYSKPPTFGSQIILKWMHYNFVCVISHCVNLLQIKTCYCQGNHIGNTTAQYFILCTSLNIQFMELYLKYKLYTVFRIPIPRNRSRLDSEESFIRNKILQIRTFYGHAVA